MRMSTWLGGQNGKHQLLIYRRWIGTWPIELHQEVAIFAMILCISEVKKQQVWGVSQNFKTPESMWGISQNLYMPLFGFPNIYRTQTGHETVFWPHTSQHLQHLPGLETNLPSQTSSPPWLIRKAFLQHLGNDQPGTSPWFIPRWPTLCYKWCPSTYMEVS